MVSYYHLVYVVLVHYLLFQFFVHKFSPLHSMGGKPAAVEDGFHQLVAAVAQRQQEEGGVLPKQIQEDLVTLPFGKAVQKFPADPLQIAFVTFFQLPFKAIGGEKIHILAFALVIQEGHNTTALPGGEGQAGLFFGFPQQAFVR